MKKTMTTLSLMAVCSLSHFAYAQEIAPLEKALTLAQIESDKGKLHSLLVLQDTGNAIKAVNLSEHFNHFPDDPLTLVEKLGYEKVVKQAESLPYLTVAYTELLPAGGYGNQHIAAGTNYVEHGIEADVHEVFLFPKYAKATPSRTQIQFDSQVLLDYEAEICMRWSDRVETIEDTRQHYAGLFLCGDFTDRAELLRKIDVDNVVSGHGFSDAKSGEGRFPTGPYIVVPKDWLTFVPTLSFSTYVNGEKRQEANAGEMIKDPQALVKWILDIGQQSDWKYRDQEVPLLTTSAIQASQNLITGTPEGVIYNTPGWGYRITKSVKWLATLSFIDSGPVDYILEEYIAESFEDNRYLQAGDAVHLTGRYLGNIEVNITKP